MTAVHRLQLAPAVRSVCIAAALAGCSFDGAEVQLGVDARPLDAAPDAPRPGSRTTCDATDPQLRLCIDFDGPARDRSANNISTTSVSVGTVDRRGDPAASFTAAAQVHDRATPRLDIPSNQTIELWARPGALPDPPARFWLLDNNTQYAVSLTTTGNARCVIGNRLVDSDATITDGAWHHVACSYDGARLRVYVDGSVRGCLALTAPIPVDGSAGVAIGANLSGTDEAPEHRDQYVGDLDDVRIWARTDLDLCEIAGRTGCQTTCPE
ncbi:MAG: LamG domain-containing protein [Kofleriaceae bacterium]